MQVIRSASLIQYIALLLDQHAFLVTLVFTSSLKVYHGPIHQALTKQLNPDFGLRAKGCVLRSQAIWLNPDFHPSLIRTSFI